MFRGRASCVMMLLCFCSDFSASFLPDNKVQEFSMKILASSDLSKVTSCMQHALSSRYPRTRYSAGWDAKFLWIPLSYLPTCIADIFTSIIMPSMKESWTSLERITENNTAAQRIKPSILLLNLSLKPWLLYMQHWSHIPAS